MILDLNVLRDEANAWLLDQRCNRALAEAAIERFRARYCLPWFVVDAIRPRKEKERGCSERRARPRDVGLQPLMRLRRTHRHAHHAA